MTDSTSFLLNEIVTTLQGGNESEQACDAGGIGILPAAADVSASDATFDDRVEIAWADTSDLEDGFVILRDGTALDTTAANAISYTDFTAPADVTLTYRVRAFSDSGGVASTTNSFDDGERAVIVAPFNIQATDGTFEDRIVITWESISTTTIFYKIFRDGTLIKTVNASTLFYEDFGATAGVNHSYSVVGATASNVNSTGGLLEDGRRELDAPTGVQASDGLFEDRVLLTWNDNSAFESGYFVYRRETTQATVVLIDTLFANRTSFIDTTGTPAVTYEYSVAAFDSVGAAIGQSQLGADLGNRVLKPPTSVQASDGEFEDQIEITWSDNSSAENGYRIFREGVLHDLTLANVTIYIDASPSFGDTLTYDVVAFDALGQSASSSDDGFTTILAPLSFNASDTYADSVVLAWVDVSAIESGYRITRDGTAIDTTNANVTSYVDNDATPGPHAYCVETINGAAVSVPVCNTGISPVVPLPTTVLMVKLINKVTASDGAAEDEFGKSVSISGDYAIVGARQDGNNKGAAYIFLRTGSTWTQQAKLTAGGAGIRFGISVSISGDYAIVGAHRADNGRGVAFIFKRSGITWTQEAKLQADDRAADDRFGISVSISGDYAIVGAHQADSEKGAGYIFKRSGSTWTEQQKLTASVRANNDHFGEAVSISGDYAIAGAHQDDDNGNNAGSAYIFLRSGSTWTEQAKLTANDAAADDDFGKSVSMSGDYTIVGAHHDDDNGNDSGSAYIFQRSGITWAEQAKLTANDGAFQDEFGISVSISGDYTIVGAWQDNDQGSDSSSAYTFKRSGSTWTEQAKFTASDGENSDGLGVSVAMSGGKIIIGAYLDDDQGTDAGAAYFFEVVVSPTAVSASDGNISDRVQIKWQDISNKEDGFRIYRDDQASAIAEVVPNSISYADFDAVPGRSYEYSVVAFNNILGEAPPASDFGRRPPDGNITGRISSRAGAGVDSVEVSLDPAPNKALLFDGVGGHVMIEDPVTESGLSNFTIEFWMRSNDTQNQGTPFSIATATQPNAVVIWDYKNFKLVVNNTSRTTNVSANDGQWHHIALAKSSNGSYIFYLDGNPADSGSGLGGSFALPTSSILILGQEQDTFGGGFQQSEAFRGQLDEVRIWGTALSQNQIQDRRNVRLAGDEQNLVGYWRFDEGAGSVAADLANTDVSSATPAYGKLMQGVYFSADAAPVEASAFTDLEGNYVLDDIIYGTATTFKVIPSKGQSQFEPGFKTITLNRGNPVQNEVGFKDITAFTVTGVVKFERNALDPDALCLAGNIVIEVDGNIAGATDKDGEYAIAVSAGEHTITAKFADHTFSPSDTTIDVRGNQAGLNFINTTQRILSGKVGGGPACDLSIGTLTLEIRSENNCFQATLSADGPYIEQLPPQKYLVRVIGAPGAAGVGLNESDVLDFFSRLGPQEIDLTDADSTADFIYRAPLVVSISGFESFIDSTCVLFANVMPIIAQGSTAIPLTILVSENYGSNGLCPVDTGQVTIFDEIDDAGETVLPISNGVVSYTTHANTPSVTSGRRDAQGNDRSFQKLLQVIAEVEGQNAAVADQWALVTGQKPRTGSFITATSGNMPILILRDPPGDGSFSFVEEGTTICNTFSEATLESVESGIKTKIKAGIRFEKGTGFWSSETKIEAETENVFKLAVEFTQDGSLQICATATQRYSTSADELFVGAEGDVFLGVALNYTFAKTDVIEVEGKGAACRVVQSEAVTYGGEGFETTYLFTDFHIRNILIPLLDDLRQNAESNEFESRADSLQDEIDNWNKHLSLNDDLKEEAKFQKNRSFSAGADYEFSQTSDTTGSFSWTNKITAENELALGLDFEETGSGTSNQFIINLNFERTITTTDDTTVTRTVGYTLSDNDIGDFFSVNISDDGAFNTPVFELISGTTSCPWEPGQEYINRFLAGDPMPVDEAQSQPRDWLAIKTSTGSVFDVPPDGSARILLTLVNKSQSGESREYHLRAINANNLDGALLKVNGQAVAGDPVSFFLPPGSSTTATMEVARGPHTYNYDNLAVMLVAPCEYERWQNGQNLIISDTVFFDVRFDAPCSDINLTLPVPDWTISADSSQQVRLVMSDFDLTFSDEDSIDLIGAEYRLLGTQAWNVINSTKVQFNALKLTPGADVIALWNVSGVADGRYELRAFTSCATGKGVSGVKLGTIDRVNPEVFGTPQPADQVLNLGEDISITFNEDIRCSTVNAINVQLLNLSNSTPVITDLVCNGRSIIINPSNLVPLEGETLEASVSGIKDLLGNTLAATQTWPFTVQINQFAWSQASITKTVPFRNPGSFTATLVNGSPQVANYSFSSPAWLTLDPFSGTLPIGGSQDISFAIDSTLPIGDTTGTVTASATGLQNTDLQVNLSVECIPPTWQVDPGKFSYSMNIVAQLDINGNLSTDTNDMVAAFVGNQLRGAANVELVGSGINDHMAFITVYSNIASGENVRFHVWDDSDCLEYDATVESFAFAADATFGTPGEPKFLTAIQSTSTDSLQIVALNQGWTWFSMNVTPASFSVSSVLSDLNASTGDRILSRTDTSTFNAGTGWVGTTLLNLDNVSSYAINLSEAGTLVLDGQTVDPATTNIPIIDGWNWIGYTPQVALEINAALSDLDVSEDDVIKSQFAFAQVVKQGSSLNWIGNLTTMEPGKGYRLFLKNAKLNLPGPSFIYPENPPSAAPVTHTVVQVPGWSLNPMAYQRSMTVTAVVEIDGAEMRSSEVVVGAFVNGECRGIAELRPVEGFNRYEAFLLVHSNEVSGESIFFKVFDATDERVLEITETLAFVVDASYGSVVEPLVLSAASVTSVGAGQNLPTTYNLAQNHPNPFNPGTQISFALPEAATVTLEVYNILGQKVVTLFNGDLPAGYHNMKWDATDEFGQYVGSGVYLFRLEAGTFMQVKKMMLMK